MNIEKEFTVIIKTIERPRLCQLAIDSVKNFYPNMTVLVCDDSPNKYDYKSASKIIRPGEDVGAGKGRNILIDEVQTKYTCMLDDDNSFFQEKTLERMLDVYLNTPFHIIAGRYKSMLSPYYINHYLIDKHLACVRSYHSVYPYKDYIIFSCDQTTMFILALSKVLKEIRFDDGLKVVASWPDFYLRTKLAHYSACVIKNVLVRHKHTYETKDKKGYRRFRNKKRVKRYVKAFCNKWGFSSHGQGRFHREIPENAIPFDVFNENHHSYRGNEWTLQSASKHLNVHNAVNDVLSL